MNIRLVVEVTVRLPLSQVRTSEFSTDRHLATDLAHKI